MKDHDDRRSSGQAGSYVYKCSMHPLVQFVHGGFCPQCGMALEPAKVWPRPVARAKASRAEIGLWVAATATTILGLVVAVRFQSDALPSGRGVEWFDLLLATLVCLGSAGAFHLRTIRAAGRGTFDMSTLASLGMLAPYVAGTLAVLAPEILPTTFRHDSAGIAFYFATACAAATLVLLGQVLEGRVSGATAKARHSYLGNPFLPKEAGDKPLRRFGRLVMSLFAPTVLVAAVCTVAAWGFLGDAPHPSQALLHGLALLLVACPCAFGLAAPLSSLFAIRRAAASGMLFKDAASMEILSRIDTLAMGKSETIAMGSPDLDAVVAVPAHDEETVLRYAASLETGIHHPLAYAIIEGAKHRAISRAPATEIESIPARGVRGRVEGRSVAVGNLSMMVHHDSESGALGQTAETLRAAGATVVYVSLDGHPIGLIGFRDHIRESAVSDIRALRRDGLRIVLLTGDSVTTAQALAKRFELDEVRAEITDGGKPTVLSTIQREGRRVAMVGHDAEFGQADLGIEIGGTFDAQGKGARIALLDGDFGGIAKAREISRATSRNIRQNLILAIGGSALGVVAASGIPDPFFGFSCSPEGAAIALFSLTALVALNAFRSPR
jgi:Cu+-exporting ATPase